MRWVSGLLLVGAVVTLSLAVEDWRGGSLSASNASSAPESKPPLAAAAAVTAGVISHAKDVLKKLPSATEGGIMKEGKPQSLAAANQAAKPVNNGVGERDIQKAEAKSLVVAKEREAAFQANVMAQRTADKEHEEARQKSLREEEKRMAKIEAERERQDRDGGAATGARSSVAAMQSVLHADDGREAKEQRVIEAEKEKDEEHAKERKEELGAEARREAKMQADRENEIASDVHRGDTGVSGLAAKMRDAEASSEKSEKAFGEVIEAERRLDAKHRAEHAAEVAKESSAEAALQTQREQEVSASHAASSSVVPSEGISEAVTKGAMRRENRLDKAIEDQRKQDERHEEARKRVLSEIGAREAALQAKMTKDVEARRGGGQAFKVRKEEEIKEQDAKEEKARKETISKELGSLKTLADKALKEAAHSPMALSHEEPLIAKGKKAAEKRDVEFGEAVEGIRASDEAYVQGLDGKAALEREAVDADEAVLKKKEALSKMLLKKHWLQKEHAEVKMEKAAPIQEWPAV